VVDDGGWPLLIERVGQAGYLASLASVELAPGKSRTAALFKKPSQALEDAINLGRVAAVTARGFTEMQGALPIVVDGEVIGAIGASFDTSEHDCKSSKPDWPRSIIRLNQAVRTQFGELSRNTWMRQLPHQALSH
jgi:uncharacterized protein GlcG (DUF336 family)